MFRRPSPILESLGLPLNKRQNYTHRLSERLYYGVSIGEIRGFGHLYYSIMRILITYNIPCQLNLYTSSGLIRNRLVYSYVFVSQKRPSTVSSVFLFCLYKLLVLEMWSHKTSTSPSVLFLASSEGPRFPSGPWLSIVPLSLLCGCWHSSTEESCWTYASLYLRGGPWGPFLGQPVKELNPENSSIRF